MLAQEQGFLPNIFPPVQCSRLSVRLFYGAWLRPALAFIAWVGTMAVSPGYSSSEQQAVVCMDIERQLFARVIGRQFPNKNRLMGCVRERERERTRVR